MRFNTCDIIYLYSRVLGAVARHESAELDHSSQNTTGTFADLKCLRSWQLQSTDPGAL